MELSDLSAVQGYVDWVRDEFDDKTADQFRDMIDKRRSDGESLVLNPLKLAYEALSVAHQPKVNAALAIAKAACESEIEIE